MATYRVSYKMLAKQGEELKAVAKLVDSYAERVTQIRAKLGDNQTLAEVRTNLQKFSTQLTESRVVLSTAGGLLTSTVEKYTGVETRQVKRVDSFKAHNRDFYKNPVVVASAGGAAGGTAAAAATPAYTAAPTSAAAPASTTINYTETTTINYTEVNVAPETAAPTATYDAATPVYTDMKATTPAVEAAPVAAAATSAGGAAGIAAGVGVAAGAAGAGAVLGVGELLKNGKNKKAKNPTSGGGKPAVAQNVRMPGQGDSPADEKKQAEEEYDPEKELEAAMERVRKLSEEE
jgi:hypothetical protein